MSNEPEDDPTAYGDTHRAFLQALLARQTMTFETARPVLAAILSARDPTRPTLAGDVTQDDFDEMVDKLHDVVSPFDLEIRSMESQRTRERVYALVNGTSDAVTVAATLRGPDEMGFVRRVLDRIFEGGNSLRREVFAVKGMEALRLRHARAEGGGKTGGLTNAEAEKVLESMVKEGWFEKSRRGFYSPTERLLMELNMWLRDVYNHEDDDDDEEEDKDEDQGERGRVNIRDCMACKSIITVGHRCRNLPCDVRLHAHCLERFFPGRQQRECPTCKTDWSNPLPVGEKAARGNNDGGERRSMGGTRRSSAMNGHEEDDSDADDGIE